MFPSLYRVLAFHVQRVLNSLQTSIDGCSREVEVPPWRMPPLPATFSEVRWELLMDLTATRPQQETNSGNAYLETVVLTYYENSISNISLGLYCNKN